MILYTQLDLYKKNAYKQIALLREMFNKKEITKTNWIENKFLIADCLIKYGASSENILVTLKAKSVDFL